jgi:GT2 family glycosyltransferase
MLSWNRREDTIACLASLAEASTPLQIVVVDNGSTDGSADAVAATFPSATLVRFDRNHGFAGGANAGIKRALEVGVDAVLLLNNDMVVDPGFVEPLLAALDGDDLAAAACSQILFADAPERVWYAGANVHLERGHHGRNVGYGRPPIPSTSAPYRTDCACGGAMLIARSAIERLGLLDEELFAYREDLDWSLRAKACGSHILVVPASIVRHKISASSGGESSPTSLYYDTRNGLVVAERYAPLGAVRTRLRRGVSVLAHAAQALLSHRRRAGLRAVLAGWRDAARGRLGQRTL